MTMPAHPVVRCWPGIQAGVIPGQTGTFYRAEIRYNEPGRHAEGTLVPHARHEAAVSDLVAKVLLLEHSNENLEIMVHGVGYPRHAAAQAAQAVQDTPPDFDTFAV